MSESEAKHDAANGILTTTGIRSNVYRDGESVGHVLLMDFDGKSLSWVEDQISDLPGVTLLLESSGRSYHVWNLTVRSEKDTLWEQVKRYDDEGHFRRGPRQGFWVLRTGPKERPSQERYKPAPRLKEWGVNRTGEPQSLHHWRYAKQVFDLPDVEPSGLDWVGDSGESLSDDAVGITLDSYVTFTDELKDELW